MSETRFTPGPWVYGHQSATVQALPEYMQVAHCMSEPGCGMLHDMEEVRANARLIAAAPDLYAALEDAVATLPMVVCRCRGDGFVCSRCKALASAESALARARGEVTP
jgi:hypothetical protein